eukprot:1507187-Rhodomonas_salina.3
MKTPVGWHHWTLRYLHAGHCGHHDHPRPPTARPIQTRSSSLVTESESVRGKGLTFIRET